MKNGYFCWHYWFYALLPSGSCRPENKCVVAWPARGEGSACARGLSLSREGRQRLMWGEKRPQSHGRLSSSAALCTEGVCVGECLCVGAEAPSYIMLLHPTHRLTKSSVYNGIIWPKIHKRERVKERERGAEKAASKWTQTIGRQRTRKKKNGTRKIRCVF